MHSPQSGSHTLSAKFPCMCPVHPHMSAGRDIYSKILCIGAVRIMDAAVELPSGLAAPAGRSQHQRPAAPGAAPRAAVPGPGLFEPAHLPDVGLFLPPAGPGVGLQLLVQAPHLPPAEGPPPPSGAGRGAAVPADRPGYLRCPTPRRPDSTGPGTPPPTKEARRGRSALPGHGCAPGSATADCKKGCFSVLMRPSQSLPAYTDSTHSASSSRPKIQPL